MEHINHNFMKKSGFIISYKFQIKIGYCINCGIGRKEFLDNKENINGKLLLGRISIEEFNKQIKEIEKCLTVDEFAVKDVLE